jgi:hypothetical protein
MLLIPKEKYTQMKTEAARREEEKRLKQEAEKGTVKLLKHLLRDLVLLTLLMGLMLWQRYQNPDDIFYLWALYLFPVAFGLDVLMALKKYFVDGEEPEN